MENNEPIKHGVLTVIQNNLDKAIADIKSLSLDDLAYYEGIKKLVDLKLNEAEIKDNFNEIENVLLALGRLDFTKRIPVENAKDLFSFLGCSINLVAEELQDNAIPKAFVTPVMNALVKHKPDLAILVDNSGVIKHVTNNPENTLGYKSSELLNKKIQGILAVEIHFLVTSSGSVTEKEIHFIKPDSELAPVILSIDEVEHPTDTNQTHFLYSFRKKI